MDSVIKFVSGKYRWLSHILFWLGFIALYTLAYGKMSTAYGIKFIHTMLLLPTIVPATYLSLHLLFNRYLLNKKYIQFILGFLVSAFLFSYLQALMETQIILPKLYGNHGVSTWGLLLVGFIHVYAIVLLAGVLKLMKDYFISRELNMKLKQEKLETELKFLKGQINPHFLFNTLNNLYSLALRKDDNTAAGIMQLSHLMDYMLNESNIGLIQLDKEIELLNNYLSLEKLRYTKKLNASIDIKGITADVKIAPLILLPFIENAFKHGISKKREYNWLVIFLEITDHKLIFSVDNSIPENIKENILVKNHGIGLKNVKRRLELIYGTNFTLDIKAEKERFNIDLMINFNKEK